jgi:hypothetical protein
MSKGFSKSYCPRNDCVAQEPRRSSKLRSRPLDYCISQPVAREAGNDKRDCAAGLSTKLRRLGLSRETSVAGSSMAEYEVAVSSMLTGQMPHYLALPRGRSTWTRRADHEKGSGIHTSDCIYGTKNVVSYYEVCESTLQSANRALTNAMHSG